LKFHVFGFRRISARMRLSQIHQRRHVERPAQRLQQVCAQAHARQDRPDVRLRFRIDSGGADIALHHPGQMIHDDSHGRPTNALQMNDREVSPPGAQILGDKTAMAAVRFRLAAQKDSGPVQPIAAEGMLDAPLLHQP
jgi:hypothetical protein